MEPLFCSICSIRFICHFDTNVFESLFLFADTYQFIENGLMSAPVALEPYARS